MKGLLFFGTMVVTMSAYGQMDTTHLPFRYKADRKCSNDSSIVLYNSTMESERMKVIRCDSIHYLPAINEVRIYQPSEFHYDGELKINRTRFGSPVQFIRYQVDSPFAYME